MGVKYVVMLRVGKGDDSSHDMTATDERSKTVARKKRRRLTEYDLAESQGKKTTVKLTPKDTDRYQHLLSNEL